MKTLLVLGMLIFSALTAQAAQVSIRIGPPPAPRAYKVPARPTPQHVWVEGYHAPNSHKQYQWHNGRWATPPSKGAYWSEPYYANGHYTAGRWTR